MAEVFLMEDSEPLRRVLFEELRAAGHSVTEFADGSKSRDVALFGEADILVTDLWMPNVTGIEAIENVRKNYPDLPIIVVTGKPPQAVESLSVNKVLHKPLICGELVTLVNQLLRERTLVTV